MILTDHLDALEAWLSTHAPDLAKALRPGAEAAHLDAAMAGVAPYQLPDDVRVLYRWHNGQMPDGELIPGYRFLPIEDAVATYQMMLDLPPDMQGWNPLWFPLLDFEGDVFAVELRRIQRLTTPVFWCPNEDSDLYVWTHDLTAFVRLVVDAYRRGVYRKEDGYWERDEAGETALRETVSPGAHRFGDHEVDGATHVSRFSTQLWPPGWRLAIGRRAQPETPRGATTNIASFTTETARYSAAPATLRGTVTALTGSGLGVLIDLTDATGTVTLGCPPQIAREVQVRGRYEVDVQKREAASHAGRGSPWDDARFVVTRVAVLDGDE